LYSIGLNQKGGHIIFNKNLPGFRILTSQTPPSMQALISKPVHFIIPVIISSMILIFIAYNALLSGSLKRHVFANAKQVTL
jgi:hypothetical protein